MLVTVYRERDIILHQIQQQGKPSAFMDKQVEGKLRKYYEQVALMEQKLDMDPKLKVKDFIESTGKKIGRSVAVTGFRRMAVGEGS